MLHKASEIVFLIAIVKVFVSSLKEAERELQIFLNGVQFSKNDSFIVSPEYETIKSLKLHKTVVGLTI